MEERVLIKWNGSGLNVVSMVIPSNRTVGDRPIPSNLVLESGMNEMPAGQWEIAKLQLSDEIRAGVIAEVPREPEQADVQQEAEGTVNMQEGDDRLPIKSETENDGIGEGETGEVDSENETVTEDQTTA